MRVHWTKKDLPRLDHKIIVVTGGNSGIGFECVKEFSIQGAHVIMASRDETRAMNAINQIKKLNPKVCITFMKLDLADSDSIRTFAHSFTSSYQRLDLLINNAGIMFGKYRLTIDGYEQQFGTNHLGHFLLTGLLLDLIRKTPDSRIITLSSIAHGSGKFDFNNLQFERPGSYSSYQAYSRSKLANLLFAYELDRRFKQNGINVLSIAAHPGVSRTNLFFKTRNRPILRAIFHHFIPIQAASKGALPVLRAAVDLNAKGGDYYGPDAWFGMRGHPIKTKSNKMSHDEVLAKTLWDVSEQLTKVTYDFSVNN